MKHFFKFYSIPLLFLVGMSNEFAAAMVAGPVAMATPLDSMAVPSGIGQATPSPANQVSVHEMFKDVPQDELLAMMEEGQQFIKYLEENGTPEEKMAFAQAMEETLQGFSEEDWKEFEQIVETVQDKLPPLVIEPKNTVIEPVKQAPKKEEIKATQVDNSLEKTLHAIHKAINAILLKAKSDKVLTERITLSWNKKDDFNEMARLIQSLNTKDHIIRLTSSKDEAIKTLLESIQNFNKRLQSENDQFIIADTFGLEIDEETTAINLKKLNKILEFFDSAIESLLPKLIKFMEEYEPEALKKSKIADESAKNALDAATKIEKQKRPAAGIYPTDRNQSKNYQKNSNQGYNYNNSAAGNYAGTSKNHPIGYIEEAHLENVKNIPQLKKSSEKFQTSEKSDKSTEKKEFKKSSLEKSIDTLLDYLESYSNAEVGNYMTTINKAGNIYKSFGTPIDENSRNRATQLIEKRSKSALKDDESSFLTKYEEQLKAADKNFGKNTQQAYTYYAGLSDSIENIAPQIDEMQKVLSTIKASLGEMSSKDLEKLNASTELKNFGHRIQSYHTTFKNVQHELKNKHQLYRLQRQDPYEERDYNELATKVNSLHGLDKKIADAKSQLENLQKSIKSAIARSKRDENKAASRK